MKKSKEIKKDSLQEVFLEKFIESLVINSIPGEIEEPEPHHESKNIPSQKHITTEFIVPRTPSTINQFPTAPAVMPNTPGMQTRPITQQAPRQMQPWSNRFLGKVSPLLQDPTIVSVECPGPGKNLIINKTGMIQRIQTILSQPEINKIINDISEKTRIPLIQGMFKAALGNLTVTAVISEFVGTRFVIEKRRRPMRYR